MVVLARETLAGRAFRPACPAALGAPVRCRGAVPGPRASLPASRAIAASSRCSGRVACRAYEGLPGSSRDPSLDGFVEVKVDQVRVSSGNALAWGSNARAFCRSQAVVYLRILDGRATERVLPVHIGENESNALLKEINKQRQMRPLTHDVMKNILRGAVNHLQEHGTHIGSWIHVAADHTIPWQRKDLAVKEERFEDAREMQQLIYYEMTHNQMLRLVVAMESALADGRYDEAARLRDEFKKMASNVGASEQRRA
ncbi:hypothetical protein TSOC_011303 [Tetrabaena socialis]|uniref:BFN domain-containing protein n=1 Tax=Tetrabaena socialis TaxID=47790 RepID=A0A2J7ZR11_9CHLO|nr:hypothetical protein TSOC_011303 [Tetrabaena socialis]|eukprot:PNH02707.1 hypothetical protein TSOC_011303 [Tetrabaena socialis]